MSLRSDLKDALQAAPDDPKAALALLEGALGEAAADIKPQIEDAITALKAKDANKAQGHILQALKAMGEYPKGKVPYGYEPGYAKPAGAHPSKEGLKGKVPKLDYGQMRDSDQCPVEKLRKATELCAQGREARLLHETVWDFGDIPEWIQVIPNPGKWDHPKYGKITIDAADLKEFERNFRGHVYQEHIPVDAEHETKQSGACGWYEDVRVGGPKGEPGLWAKVDWTDRGEKLLKEERFKYFSPEWFDSWTDPATGKVYHNVLVGGALTTRPFFKDESLVPLVAAEGYLWEVQKGSDGREEWSELAREG